MEIIKQTTSLGILAFIWCASGVLFMALLFIFSLIITMMSGWPLEY